MNDPRIHQRTKQIEMISGQPEGIEDYNPNRSSNIQARKNLEEYVRTRHAKIRQSPNLHIFYYDPKAHAWDGRISSNRVKHNDCGTHGRNSRHHVADRSPKNIQQNGSYTAFPAPFTSQSEVYILVFLG